MILAQEVLKFWFSELTPKDWFAVNASLDEKIRTRFKEIHEKANRAELFHWRKTNEGRLAEIIVLDQFSRNMFRGKPASFASDPMALVLAQEIVLLGLDQALTASQKAFAYLPYMHSESRDIHTEALKLFSQKGLEMNYEFELKHKKIIDRFGRFPHRNVILGRTSTAEEIEFLKEPGSSF